MPQNPHSLSFCESQSHSFPGWDQKVFLGPREGHFHSRLPGVAPISPRCQRACRGLTAAFLKGTPGRTVRLSLQKTHAGPQ